MKTCGRTGPFPCSTGSSTPRHPIMAEMVPDLDDSMASAARGLRGVGRPTYSYADARRARRMDRDLSSSDRASPGTPRTWLLASPHQGDNTQLQALAEALGWPYE